MDTEARNIITPRLIVGLGIALFGLALTLDRLHIMDADRLIRLWPVGLMLLGGVMIAQGADGRGRTRGIIFFAFGTWMFLNMQGLLTVPVWELFWPVILIIFGVSIALQTSRRAYRGERYYRRHGGRRFGIDETVPPAAPGGDSNSPFDRAGFRGGTVPPDPASTVSLFSVMSGVRRVSNAAPFRGGDIMAFMGGAHLDLRLATIPPGEEAVLDVTVMMGGVEIAVPNTWVVSTPVFPFMGAVEDKRLTPLPTDGKLPDGGSPRLIIRGFVMMGNIELRS
jgi:predicted membrane protein